MTSTVSRRAFLRLAGSAPVLAATPAVAATRATAPGFADAPTRRTGTVEIAFKSPGRPNGLQATPQGLWIIDQSPGSRASLVRYSDGQVIRSFETDTVRPSGITFDGEALWIGSTFSYENVRCDATTGAVLERRPTPGCTTYTMAGDPRPRRSPLAPPPAAAAAPAAAVPAPAARLTQTPHLRFQGAHGQEWRDGKLWTTSTSARSIYRIDPKTWVVEQQLSVPGPRPHGLAWEGSYLWHGDGDLNAFMKFDLGTGQIVEKIQLADSDPLAHGLTIWEGTLWYCDDVGVVCRMRL
jgi:sugar lactone lactonase YvrE